MKITKNLNRKQFAAAVSKQLQKNGISSVLVGGACVSIYTNGKHESLDLDFISPSSTDAIAEALSVIGFRRKGRYFIHDHSDFYVEFPSGPVAIGHEVPVKPQGKMNIQGTIVKMLSPTQSVMDRLAAWFAWNDRRSLIHAIWICEEQPVSFSKLKSWAAKENEHEKWEQFLDQLRSAKRARRSKGQN